MKRYSTTVKISIATAQKIAAYCVDMVGVIVRYKGQEYGAVSVVKTARSYIIQTWEGITLVASACTIRKTTVETITSEAFAAEASYSVETMLDYGNGLRTARIECVQGPTLLRWINRKRIDYNGHNPAAPIVSYRKVPTLTPQMVTMSGLFGCE